MKKSFFLLFFFCNISLVFANGDPTMHYSALTASSNPVPLSITDVQVMSEELYIRPGRYSEVKVKYVLYNSSDKDYKDIDYGFPVDYEGGGDEYVNSGLTSDYYSESMYTVGWQDKYIRNISFSSDGKTLPFKVSDETMIWRDKMPDRKDYPDGKDGQEEYEVDVVYANHSAKYRRWFYTQLDIPAHTAVTLEVRYLLYYSQEKSLYSSLLSRDSYSYCSLQYVLAPAAHWGDSRAREFYAEIDLRGLHQDYYPQNDIDLITVAEGLPFTRKDLIYTYRTTNFNFENAKPILIDFILRDNTGLDGLLNKRISEDKYTIDVPSEQQKYPASNLSDLDFTTAWVAANGGTGEKITVKFKEPAAVRSLAWVNGYQKSKNTFLENNRPLKVNMIIYYVSGGDEYTIEETLSMNNREYQPVSLSSLRYHPDVYIWNMDDPFSDTKVSKIEFEIESITPGDKYNDTCISEILFFEHYNQIE